MRPSLRSSPRVWDSNKPMCGGKGLQNWIWSNDGMPDPPPSSPPSSPSPSGQKGGADKGGGETEQTSTVGRDAGLAVAGLVLAGVVVAVAWRQLTTPTTTGGARGGGQGPGKLAADLEMRTVTKTALAIPTPISPGLPPGWQQARDPNTGAVYYYNSQTGQSTWDRP